MGGGRLEMGDSEILYTGFAILSNMSKQQKG